MNDVTDYLITAKLEELGEALKENIISNIVSLTVLSWIRTVHSCLA